RLSFLYYRHLIISRQPLENEQRLFGIWSIEIQTQCNLVKDLIYYYKVERNENCSIKHIIQSENLLLIIATNQLTFCCFITFVVNEYIILFFI
ncbi:MAG: hypothetical protein ACTHKC_03800, partial [Candidatus Nitrosocosmicus sp.]